MECRSYFFHTLADFDGSSRTNVAQENLFLLTHFPAKHLIRGDGTLLDPPIEGAQTLDYLIMESFDFGSSGEGPEAHSYQMLTRLLAKYPTLPPKLIFPFGGRAHTACVVLESQGNQKWTITALDLMSSTSNFGWKEIAAGIEKALKEHNSGATVKTLCNNWSQNNALRCGTHVMLNVTFATNHDASLYHSVKQGNKNADDIPAALKLRSKESLVQSYEGFRKKYLRASTKSPSRALENSFMLPI